MQVSFTLRKDKINKDGFIPVRMLITVNGERIRRNVKNVKTIAKDWKNQRIKSNLKSETYNYHLEYNKELDDLENKVKLIYRNALLNNIAITKEYILDKLDNENFGSNNLTPNFFDSFQEFIDTNKTTKAKGTIKKYVSCKNFIQDFDTVKNYNLRFDNININFYEEFRDYSFDERNTLNNYFGRIISVLKTFMNWSFERNYHENLEFKKFKTVSNTIEVIYLTMDELMTLYNHKFDSTRLEHVRDFYCFGCFTGLRFSDIKQLRPSNVFSDHIKLNITKTKSIDHKIPLNNYAKAILDKYKETLYEPLPAISSQKFNKYIKECAEIVKINKPLNITRYIGQRRVDKVLPKYELITSHTARKTFVTNSLILGMKEMVVRNITGHKDESSFKRYVEIADDFKNKEMDDTWNKI
ncbi:site-specific integrase [Aquimarina algicola]|uniref:Site-specific integrase n=1 Tax=Aquimarina algicola TaxID=2589995 RepID=A0A504JGW1_9FLAO|nr:site-specific integrase [Aquimarina algicola]TPN86069.1 site-specific integrase [Aquimarina algicola]